MTIVGEERDTALLAEESTPGPYSPIRTQRTLQIVLGLFWILDAALQYQPYMFGKDFVPTFITANASGQPGPLAWLITTAGHFVGPDVAVWNTLFATIQLAIGAGLLFRRTVRPALAISIVWSLSVWIFGEGLGMILTGTASALTGAPGSVLLYGALALMAWPRRQAPNHDRVDSRVEVTGIASSPAAQGLGGVITPLVVWSGYWVLAALLFVFPANRTQTSISSAITGMAPGTPEWYSHFLTSFGHAFSSVGTQSAWVLAIVSLVIGLGPLVVRRPGIFLASGGLLSALMWITGQGFLGNVLSGSGTDPNTGPLVILLALAMTPTVLSLSPTWRSPIAALLRYRPAAVVGGGTAILCGLILAGTYPAAAQESSSASMSGMTMSGSSGSSDPSMSGTGTQTASAASCTKGNNGVARSGLDVTNTPNMVMGVGGVGTERDQGQLVLYRASPADGPVQKAVGAREQRARPDPYGCHRVRRRTHLFPADRCYPVRAGHDPGCGSVLVAGLGRGRRLRRRLPDRLSGGLLRQSDDHGGERRRQKDPGSAIRRWPHLCGDAVGPTGSGCCPVPLARYCQKGPHALWATRAVASTHRRLWADHRINIEPAAHYGRRPVCVGDRTTGHAVHDDGVAGPGGGRTIGHSAP